MKIFLGLGVLAVLASSNVSYASRNLDSVEKKEVLKAVSFIRKMWPSLSSSSDLINMFSENRILAEDSWDDSLHGETSFPILGTQVITLNAHKIPNPNSKIYQTGIGPSMLFADRAWLASVLVHEWFHAFRQSYMYIHFHRFSFEVPAWQTQANFLKTVLDTYKNDKKIYPYIESLYESATEEVKAH